MTEEFRRLEAIFHEAIELTCQAQRCAYLDSVCRFNESLRVNVESLIESHRAAQVEHFIKKENVFSWPLQYLAFLSSPPPAGAIFLIHNVATKRTEGGFCCLGR